MDFSADLSLFYIDFTVDVIHTPKVGGASTSLKAFHDQPGLTIIGGDVLATDHTLRFQTASLPVVRKGDTFQIGAVTYTARENAQPLTDGLELTVPLARN